METITTSRKNVRRTTDNRKILRCQNKDLMNYWDHDIFKQAYKALLACRSDPAACRRDDIDQCPATIETTLRRLAILLAIDKLEEKHLLLLGDDDLLSVAIAAANIPINLTVVDLDSALLERIKRWTQNCRIELLHYDLRQKLPSNLFSRFDFIFMDPPYTLAGQLLFLKQAIVALRPNSRSSLYLSASRFYLNQEQIDKVIQAARVAGLRLAQIYEDFSEYPPPPDVAEDIRTRTGRNTSEFLRSSMFNFKPQKHCLSPESIILSSSDIYEYKHEVNDVTY